MDSAPTPKATSPMQLWNPSIPNPRNQARSASDDSDSICKETDAEDVGAPQHHVAYWLVWTQPLLQMQLLQCNFSYATFLMQLLHCNFSNATSPMQLLQCIFSNATSLMQLLRCNFPNTTSPMQLRWLIFYFRSMS